MFQDGSIDHWNVYQTLAPTPPSPANAWFFPAPSTIINPDAVNADVWDIYLASIKIKQIDTPVPRSISSTSRTCACGNLINHFRDILCVICDTDIADCAQNWERATQQFRRQMYSDRRSPEFVHVNLLVDFTTCYIDEGTADEHNGVAIESFIVVVLQSVTARLTGIIHLAEVGRRCLETRAALENVR